MDVNKVKGLVIKVFQQWDEMIEYKDNFNSHFRFMGKKSQMMGIMVGKQFSQNKIWPDLL